MNRSARHLLSTVGAATLLCGVSAAQSWQPPSGGAVEMFRRGERPFTVGARSGGAGGDGSAGARPDGDLIPTERTLRFELAPVESWDGPRSPAGNGLDGGRVYLYRRGEFTPRIVAVAEEPVALPAGTWYVVGETPGRVTTFSPPIEVRPGESGSGDLVLPLMPACVVHLTDDTAWETVERVDLVSLTEAAVYPLDPGERREAWVPAGRHLAYTVVDGKVRGISSVRTCEPGERLQLAPPAPPREGRQGLILSVRMPRRTRVGGDRIRAEVQSGGGGEGTTSPPTATLWQGGWGFFFFPDVPGGAVEVKVDRADGGTRTLALSAGEGVVHERSVDYVE